MLPQHIWGAPVLLSTWSVDPVKILTRRELAALLADHPSRSVSRRMNRVILRLACCCGLRVSEIGALRLADGRTCASGPTAPRARRPAPFRCGGTPAHLRT